MKDPQLEPSDSIHHCPRCKGRHAVSAGLIRTDVERRRWWWPYKRLVSIKTGNVMDCICGYRYASTDEGVFEMGQAMQHQHVAGVVDEMRSPEGAPPVVRLTPREKRSRV